MTADQLWDSRTNISVESVKIWQRAKDSKD